MQRCSSVLRCVGAAASGGAQASRPVTFTVKPLFRDTKSEPDTSVLWTPSEQTASDDGGSGANTFGGSATSAGKVHRRPRSPFAVLRGQPSAVGACTSTLRTHAPAVPLHPSTTASQASATLVPPPELCACAALVYPCENLESQGTPLTDEGRAVCAVRDQFLMALKLSPGSEARLRCCVSDSELAGLFINPYPRASPGGRHVLSARLVTLCNEPPTHAQRRADASGQTEADDHWVARLLLPAEEGSRVRWLSEESMSFKGSLHRAPSLRSLAVMVSIQRSHAHHTGHAVPSSTGSSSSYSPTEDAVADNGRTRSVAASEAVGADGLRMSSMQPLLAPTLSDVLQIEKRMEDRGDAWSMVDLAALASVAGGDPDVAAHLLQRCKEMLMPTVVTTQDNASNGSGGASDAVRGLSRPAQLQRDFGQIIAALVLWQQAMHFLDAVLPSAVEDRGTSPNTASSPAAPRGGADAHATTHGLGHVANHSMESPSAILRGQRGKEFHFPVIDLLDASSNLLRLHRAYLHSTAAQDHNGRPGTGAKSASDADRDVTHSLWRSASATARGLFPFGSDDTTTTTAAIESPRGQTTTDRHTLAQAALPSAPSTATTEASTSDVDEPALPLPEDPTLRAVLFHVLDHLYKDVSRLAAETSNVIDNAEYLSAVTGWLLMEAANTEVCARHFRRLVESDSAMALKALERSGLFGRQKPNAALDLRVIVSRLLPLLHRCENEDFYNSALREVLALLEDQLRSHPDFFTHANMAELAAMGTTMFGVPLSEAGHASAFDASVRGQMEELHVMDGSPWALVVASYTALKEMTQGLLRDHRKLKEQVQDQMRNIGLIASKDDQAAVAAAVAPPPAAPAVASFTPSHTEASAYASASPARLTASPALRHRFLVFVEDLVKSLVDDKSGVEVKRPIVVSSALFDFVNRQVPVPNIQDEYRRKIFLLVNVAEDAETTRQRELARQREEAREAEEARRSHRHSSLLTRLVARRAARKSDTAAKTQKEGDDAHGGVDEIPAELRFLVSSLPLTLSPWASVMILREVLAESAGNNPRYSYVLKAAIDLQLPISTTRSRIATTLNMWRFLNSQSHKLSLKDSVLVKQRCVWNLPLSYILSSYWSLLTSFLVAFLVILNVVGIDFESQLVANRLFQEFAPFAELDVVTLEDWHKEAAIDLAADYLEQDELARKKRAQRSSANVILSSASYIFLGFDDQRRPFTLVPVSSGSAGAEARHAEEYAGATAVLRELSLHAPFPFFVNLEALLPLELLEARVADRIRRVSFNNTWFGPRMIIRTFPLGRQYTEHSLIAHTCAQANLTRRRITFLVYIRDGVPVTETYLKMLMESQLAQSANLVLVTHERSLLAGGVTVHSVERLMNLPPPPSPQPDPQAPPSVPVNTSANGGSDGGVSWLSRLMGRKAATSADTCADTRTSEAMGQAVTTTEAAGVLPPPAGNDIRLRVLPYSRQLFEQGACLSAQAAARTSGTGTQRGPQRAAKVPAGMPSDSRLSPFARRFKDARRSLWQNGDAPRQGGSDGGSFFGLDGRRLLRGLWNNALRPATEFVVSPVVAAVRTVKGGQADAGEEGGKHADGSQKADVPAAASAGDSDTHHPPMHDLVSVPAEMVKSTVLGTTKLVTDTTKSLWFGLPRVHNKSDSSPEGSVRASADESRLPTVETPVKHA